MTQINWGIASGPSSFENALAKGVQMGQMVRQQREESEYKNALAKVYGGGGQTQPQTPATGGGIVATPGQEAQGAAMDQRLGTQGVTVNDGGIDRGALAVIAQRNPALAQRIQEEQAEKQQAAVTADLTQRAMSGDKDALGQLANVNFDRWKALEGQQRQAAEAEAKRHGGAAMYALQQRDPAARRAIVQSYAQQTGDQKIAALLQLPDDQLEAKLRSAVFEADLVGKLIELERPSYQAVPYESTLVNTRDPAAVQAFLGGGTGPGAAPQVKQIGGKSYFQDANGDWYEDDGGATQGGSPTFREAFGN